MKVKCKKIINEHTNREEKTSYWLTIGKEYIVLEIEIYPEKDIFYRLVGDNDNKTPALYSASQFEVISNKLPVNWNIKLNFGAITVGPRPWQEPGFWEDFYDRDPKAVEIYKIEGRKIYEEENAI